MQLEETERVPRRFPYLLPAALVVTTLAMGCFAPRYLAQAAYGQLRMYADARPIEEVIADPDTPDHVRQLLTEIDPITAFARRHGLASKGNYRKYIDLKRSASVWFVAASKPLAFEPKVWCWPIVGCFPMLGWFELNEAVAFRKQLRKHGWEVYLRGAAAYSTAGWFKDPIVSTMIRADENALGDLANVVLHELVHANVLIPDQAYFNESVAAFIGDGLAAAYLRERYGAHSAELAAYVADLAEIDRRGALLLAAYEELDALYKSDLDDAAKRRAKKKVFDGLEREMRFLRRPNNATLVGIRTYRIGIAEFEQLHQACAGDWQRFIAVIKALPRSAFASPLQEDLAPVILPLARAGCVAPE